MSLTCLHAYTLYTDIRRTPVPLDAVAKILPLRHVHFGLVYAEREAEEYGLVEESLERHKVVHQVAVSLRVATSQIHPQPTGEE